MQHRSFLLCSTLNGILLVGSALLSAGCAQKETNTEAVAKSGTEPTKGVTDAAQPPQSPPAAGPRSRGEELLLEQIQIYDKMSDRYEKVMNQDDHKREMRALGQLMVQLTNLNKEFNALSPEVKSAAQKVVASEMKEAMVRYFEAKKKAFTAK